MYVHLQKYVLERSSPVARSYTHGGFARFASMRLHSKLASIIGDARYGNTTRAKLRMRK